MDNTFNHLSDSTAWRRDIAADRGQQRLGASFSPAFTLTNAVEELTFAFQEKRETTRTLKERALRNYKPPEIPDDVPAVLEVMRDEAAADTVADFTSHLIDLAEKRNNLLQAARRWNADPVKQYLTLAQALNNAGQRQAKPHAIEALRDAVAHTLERHGPVIRASLNTLDQAAAFGPNQAAVDTFRATYCDAVFGHASLAQTLAVIIERFGDNLERGIALLRQALGADMGALQPSCPPERLHAILQDLYHLGVAASVLQRCRQITDRLRRHYPALEDRLPPLALMKDLVQWTEEPWIMGYHVSQLMEKYDADDVVTPDQCCPERDDSPPDEADKPRLAFLNGVLDVLRSLPPKVFLSQEHQLQAVDAVLQLLDSILLPEET